LRRVEIIFDARMNTLASRSDNVLEVEMFANPSFNKFLFVAGNSSLHNVANVIDVA